RFSTDVRAACPLGGHPGRAYSGRGLEGSNRRPCAWQDCKLASPRPPSPCEPVCYGLAPAAGTHGVGGKRSADTLRTPLRAATREPPRPRQRVLGRYTGSLRLDGPRLRSPPLDQKVTARSLVACTSAPAGIPIPFRGAWRPSKCPCRALACDVIASPSR